MNFSNVPLDSDQEVWSILALTWADGRPALRARVGGSTTSTLLPIEGETLSFKVLPDEARPCLGRFDYQHGGVYVDCLESPQNGQRCEKCSMAESIFAANMHQAHLRSRSDIQPQFRDHLAQPHVLYIAAFPGGELKVGTSVERRCHERLSEQGAWIAMVVAAAPDGYSVRRLEDAATASLRIGQTVSMRRKVDGYANPLPRAEVERSVNHAAGKLHELAESMSEAFPIMLDRWEAPNDELERCSVYTRSLQAGAHSFTVRSLYGKVGIIEASPGSGMVFASDLGKMAGCCIELGEVEPDPLSVQQALF